MFRTDLLHTVSVTVYQALLLTVWHNFINSFFSLYSYWVEYPKSFYHKCWKLQCLEKYSKSFKTISKQHLWLPLCRRYWIWYLVVPRSQSLARTWIQTEFSGHFVTMAVMSNKLFFSYCTLACLQLKDQFIWAL